MRQRISGPSAPTWGTGGQGQAAEDPGPGTPKYISTLEKRFQQQLGALGCFQPHGSRHHEADEEAHGVLVT